MTEKKREFTTWNKEKTKYWVPGENYRPASRFQRLLQGYVTPEKPARTVIVGCDFCKCPKKIKVNPKVIKKSFKKPQECWGGVESESQRECSQIQLLFDDWLSKTASRPPPANQSSVLSTTIDKKNKWKPHHYYHHNVGKSQVNDSSETKITKKKNKLIFCSKCPDPYRPWLRRSTANHLYTPDTVSLPITMSKSTSDGSLELSKTQSNNSRLRQLLSSILESG